MAKCKYWKYCLQRGKGQSSMQGPYCAGTDSNCNIIKPKPRTKLVKVKAWAWIHKNDGDIETTSCIKTDVPCHILIDRKYLKGAQK